MDRNRVIAALVCFAYLLCISGPVVALLHFHRAGFILFVLGLAVFGWPAVKPFAKRLTE